MVERMSHVRTRRSGGLWAGGANWLRRLAMGLLTQTEARCRLGATAQMLTEARPGRGARSRGKLEVGGEDGVAVMEHSDAKEGDSEGQLRRRNRLKPNSTKFSACSAHPTHWRHSGNVILSSRDLSVFVPKQSSF